MILGSPWYDLHGWLGCKYQESASQADLSRRLTVDNLKSSWKSLWGKGIVRVSPPTNTQKSGGGGGGGQENKEELNKQDKKRENQQNPPPPQRTTKPTTTVVVFNI